MIALDGNHRDVVVLQFLQAHKRLRQGAGVNGPLVEEIARDQDGINLALDGIAQDVLEGDSKIVIAFFRAILLTCPAWQAR